MATVVEISGGELTDERIARVKAELVETDGEPLETPWHRAEINLLIDQVKCRRRGRTDYYVGGNMFIYYSLQQARSRKYRGPDFYLVEEVDGTKEREYWWVFEEDGRLPNLIVELISSTTAHEDRVVKKELYRSTFRTPEYFCYDPRTERLEGWRLVDGEYQPIPVNEKGWMWSEVLELWLGTWDGPYLDVHDRWLRFYDAEGNVVPIEAELERRRADDAQRRADDAQRQADDAQRQADDAERRADDAQRQADDAERRADDAQRQADDAERRADDAQRRADDAERRADDAASRAADEQRRTDEQQRRAEAAEAELNRMRALLAEKGIAPPAS